MKRLFFKLFIALILTVAAVPGPSSLVRAEEFGREYTSDPDVDSADFILRSSSFANEGTIPDRHTCLGEDKSPPLSWKNAPEGTVSFALIVTDPDSTRGTWVHWIVYNISPETMSLREGAFGRGAAGSAEQGLNDFRKPIYGGPCPPTGVHRYYFTLYALDSMIDAPGGLTKLQLERAMEGHVLESTELIGLYEKKVARLRQ